MIMIELANLAKRHLQLLVKDERVEEWGQGGGRRDGVLDGESVRRHEACGMCGRTLLTGETTELYADAEETVSFLVCTICRPTARQFGYRKLAP